MVVLPLVMIFSLVVLLLVMASITLVVVFMMVLLVMNLFSWFLLFLRLCSKAEHLAVRDLSQSSNIYVSLFPFSFALFLFSLLVFLCLEDFEFFFLNPVCFDFSLFDWLLLGSILAKIDAFGFVVLLKSHALWFFRFLFFDGFFSDFSIFSLLFLKLFFIEFVIKISNISSSFSGSIISTSSTSSIVEVSICQFISGLLPIVSNFWVFFCFFRGLLVDGLSYSFCGILGFLDLLLFSHFSLLMG